MRRSGQMRPDGSFVEPTGPVFLDLGMPAGLQASYDHRKGSSGISTVANLQRYYSQANFSRDLKRVLELVEINKRDGTTWSPYGLRHGGQTNKINLQWSSDLRRRVAASCSRSRAAALGVNSVVHLLTSHRVSLRSAAWM